MTETVAQVELDQLCINTIRTLAMDAVQQADSGHPGTAMALAPLAYVLWQRHLKYNPANPEWLDRDRFVLSAGHACMLLYSVLYLTGYRVTLDDIKHFRQWASRTPGHSEHGITPGVEATTGPLGQGVGNAVGMAIAEVQLAAHQALCLISRKFNGFGAIYPEEATLEEWKEEIERWKKWYRSVRPEASFEDEVDLVVK